MLSANFSKLYFLIDKCINDNDNNNDPYINKQKPIKEKTLSKNTPERLVNSSLDRIRQLLYMLFIKVPGFFLFRVLYSETEKTYSVFIIIRFIPLLHFFRRFSSFVDCKFLNILAPF